MGDKLRQLAGLLRRAAEKALIPALLTCLVAVPTVGSSMEIDWGSFQVLLIVCLALYLQWIISLLLVYWQQRGFRIERTDAEIIGNAFGGMGKKSRMFCRALADVCDNNLEEGLDGFLAVLEMQGLTDKERQLCHFYIGRCYQMTGCSANAVQSYQRARELGMDNPYLLLFQARSMPHEQCMTGCWNWNYRSFPASARMWACFICGSMTEQRHCSGLRIPSQRVRMLPLHMAAAPWHACCCGSRSKASSITNRRSPTGWLTWRDSGNIMQSCRTQWSILWQDDRERRWNGYVSGAVPEVAAPDL